MEISKPQLSSSQISLESALTRKEYHETKAKAHSPSSLPAHHILFSKTMALIQWVFMQIHSTS